MDNKIGIILSVIATSAWLFVMAPAVLRLNRGKALRNIALWLAIVLTLILIYKTFGPGSPHALFGNIVTGQ